MDINRFQRSLEWLMECGISLKKISEEIGKNCNYLSTFKNTGFNPSDAALEEIRIAFKKRGIILSRFSPKNGDFSELYNKAGMRVGKLADKLEVSRQAINKGNLSADKLDKLTKEINKIGNTLLQLVS